MDREQEIKAAIIVTKEAIAFASPEMNHASEIAANSLGAFVDWLETLDPELERHESILLASGILSNLSELLSSSPQILDGLKEQAQYIKSLRRK